MRLLAGGLPNKEIAARLVISRKTASSHVEHMYSKVGVSSPTAASLFAVQHGLSAETAPIGPERAEMERANRAKIGPTPDDRSQHLS